MPDVAPEQQQEVTKWLSPLLARLQQIRAPAPLQPPALHLRHPSQSSPQLHKPLPRPTPPRLEVVEDEGSGLCPASAEAVSPLCSVPVTPGPLNPLHHTRHRHHRLPALPPSPFSSAPGAGGAALSPGAILGRLTTPVTQPPHPPAPLLRVAQGPASPSHAQVFSTPEPGHAPARQLDGWSRHRRHMAPSPAVLPHPPGCSGGSETVEQARGRP
ncbi:hypothetical protein V8C86DRAFT_2717138 [Haematococcus lacustris]